MTADEKYTQMTQAPVEKLICKLAVPTICSMLITSLYNMADTFFVSKINPSATGAVGVVFSLMATSCWLFLWSRFRELCFQTVGYT